METAKSAQEKNEKLSRILANLGRERGVVSSAKCALTDRQCRECFGHGFRLEARKGFIHAELCHCVKSCPSCHGLAQKIDEKGCASPCKEPWPTRICHIINGGELPGRYLHARLDAYSNLTDNHPQVLKFIQEWLTTFCQNPKTTKKGLLIGGNVGVGKTYILVSIAKHLAYKGIQVRFVDFFQLISEIKINFSKDKKQQELITPLIDAEVLLIDELGKGRQTEFEHTVIDQLVMGRYNQNKLIIASTNNPLNDYGSAYYAQRELDKDNRLSTFVSKHFPPLIDTVGDRVYSRLVETTHFLEMKGEDFRKRATP